MRGNHFDNQRYIYPVTFVITCPVHYDQLNTHIRVKHNGLQEGLGNVYINMFMSAVKKGMLCLWIIFARFWSNEAVNHRSMHKTLWWWSLIWQVCPLAAARSYMIFGLNNYIVIFPVVASFVDSYVDNKLIFAVTRNKGEIWSLYMLKFS